MPKRRRSSRRSELAKNSTIRNLACGNLAGMPAHPKLNAGREMLLLTMLRPQDISLEGDLHLGEPLETACRAISVSLTAVRKRAHRYPPCAGRFRAGREHRAPVDDWQVVAEWLETEHPDRWSLRSPSHSTPSAR